MTNLINGVDAAAIGRFADGIRDNPAAGSAAFSVITRWQGGTRSEAEVTAYGLGGKDYARRFTIAADEPAELLGTDTAPNPQELLLAALNACMTVGYVANAAAMGIHLDRLEIRAEGTLDLRGFLGLDPAVNPGYDSVRYRVAIAGDASAEAFEELHSRVIATSPNFHNFARAIAMSPTLVVEPEKLREEALD